MGVVTALPPTDAELSERLAYELGWTHYPDRHDAQGRYRLPWERGERYSEERRYFGTTELRYAMDPDWARQAELEVLAERGPAFRGAYARALYRQVFDLGPDVWAEGDLSISADELFDLMLAPPRARVLALLGVLEAS